MTEEERYVDEFGRRLPVWKPLDPASRGRYDTFAAAAGAAFRELTTVHDPFFDSLADVWPGLFPSLPLRPGRYDDGKIYLYVKSAPALFAMRPKLAMVKRRLSSLPGAPGKIELRMEIRP